MRAGRFPGRARSRLLVVTTAAMLLLTVQPAAAETTVYYRLCLETMFSGTYDGGNGLRNYRYRDRMLRFTQCGGAIGTNMVLTVQARQINDQFSTITNSCPQCEVDWNHGDWVAISDCRYDDPALASHHAFTCYYHRH